MASLLRLIASPLAAALALGLVLPTSPGLASDCAVPPESFLFGNKS